MSDEEDYISSEQLISHLEGIISNIKQKKYKSFIQQDIYDSLEDIINGNNSFNNLDKEALSFLFKGWWLTDALQKLSTGSLNTVLSSCPFCLQNMPTNKEKDVHN